MKVNRTALLAVIADAEANVQAAQDEYEHARREFTADRERVWREEVLPVWKRVGERINKAVRYGQHITLAEMKNLIGTPAEEFGGRYETYPYWTNHESGLFSWQGKNYNKVLPHRSLAPLKRLLESTSDDTISSSALEAMGFRDLSWLFQGAVKHA